MTTFAIFAMLALASLGLASAQFPYCRCIDYSDSSSPWTVVLDSSSGSSFTFKIVTRPTPSNPSACYQRLIQFGSPKLEMPSSPECLASGNKPIITINGVPSPSSGIVKPPNYPNDAAIKVIFRPYYNGSDLTFTVTGNGACTSFEKLFLTSTVGSFQFAFFSTVINGTTCCPSGPLYPPPPINTPTLPFGYFPPPPPPKPSVPFPYCRCNRGTAGSPYALSPDVTLSSTATLNSYTFTIVGKDATPGTCATADLWKIEFKIRPGCQTSVSRTAYVTPYGGLTTGRSPSFSGNFGQETLKIARLELNPSTAPNSTISFSLLKSGACPTLATLFGNDPQASLFSKNNACCPTYDI